LLATKLFNVHLHIPNISNTHNIICKHELHKYQQEFAYKLIKKINNKKN